jgi:argininosuccinate lyase
MPKLWQKGQNTTLLQILEKFETADDLTLDNNLTKFDVYGSLAHAYMLSTIGILSSQEFQQLKKGLFEILKLHQKGQFQLKFGDEDIHSKIETFLTEKYGEVGQKIHTGRSRNDQVLLDLRLFNKEKILEIWNEANKLAHLFLDLCQKYENIPMPGYTHMQKGMPSSVGMWFGSYAQSLLDSIKTLRIAFEVNDQSPLGSGAGYGLPLQLNRELVADLLGFSSVQTNSLYCQNSRGKIESIIVGALLQLMADTSRFANDVLLFTTSEFSFFTISDDLVTGSSIMPQKKNLDIAELLRSKVHIMEGYWLQIFGISTKLPSGYNRDLQDTKKPLMEAYTLANDVLKITQLLAENLTPHKENLQHAMTADLFATHQAFELVEKGMPFRQAYKEIGSNLHKLDHYASDAALLMSTHTGGTGNLCQNILEKRLAELAHDQEVSQGTFQQAIKNLETISGEK